MQTRSAQSGRRIGGQLGQQVTLSKKETPSPRRVTKSLRKTSSPSSPASPQATMAAAPLKTKNETVKPEAAPQPTAALPSPRKKRTVRKTGWKEITLEDSTVIEKTPVEPETLKLRIYPNKNQKQRLKA